MAFVSSSDISVVLSGGSTNINPNASLGGEPSATPITDGVVNNLFDDIQPEESSEGHEDYRCLYFFNDGEASVYEIEVYIEEEFEGGANIELGIESRDEIQRMTITNLPASGNLRLDYDGHEFLTEYNSDLSVWAGTLQSELRGLSQLQDVTVIAQTAGNSLIFDINFIDKDGKRSHPLIEVVANNLTPGGVEASIATTSQGSPINTIAAEIDIETTPPGNVGFYVPSSSSPITIPKLLPSEGFPVWAKRVCIAGVDPKERDGFRLRFSGQTLEPTS